jgi:hypothetical protein
MPYARPTPPSQANVERAMNSRLAKTPVISGDNFNGIDLLL